MTALSAASASSASAAQATDADGRGRDEARVLVGEQLRLGFAVAGQQDRIGSQEVSHRRHGVYCAAHRGVVAKLDSCPTHPSPTEAQRRSGLGSTHANPAASAPFRPAKTPPRTTFGAPDPETETVVINKPDPDDDPESPEGQQRERRFTAPGFDAKETAIIATPVEPATEVFPPAGEAAQPGTPRKWLSHNRFHPDSGRSYGRRGNSTGAGCWRWS